MARVRSRRQFARAAQGPAVKRWISSTELGIHNEALAMLGGYQNARRLKHDYERLVKVHIPKARAATRTAEARRRSSDRTRWETA